MNCRYLRRRIPSTGAGLRPIRLGLWRFAALLATVLTPALSTAETVLHHVHGLAFSADGRQLFVPAHEGLAIYRDGRWSKAPGPQHDYMGFSATRSRFYSSGHPAPGNGLRNPFGLIRSDDGGKTWTKRGLEGESDFHVLAASHETNAVYVFNPQPNSRMPQGGIYYTLDDGFTWRHAGAKGLAEQIMALAVHPTDSKTVAAATKAGIFLSRDAGDNFTPTLSGAQGLAVFFDLDGKHLWAASHDGQPRLTRIALINGQKTPVALPALSRDAVAYIAQNPKRKTEYAIATFGRRFYLTQDDAKNWRQIADAGNAK